MPMPDGLGDLENILGQVWPPPYRVEASSRQGLRNAELTFGLLPHPGRPTLLVPTGPRRVAECAVRGYKSPTTRGGRVRARTLGWAARAGAGYLFPWTVTISGPSDTPNLVSHIGEHLNETLYVAIALGPPRANRKPVLQLMTSSGTQVSFVKVGINPLTVSRVRAEASALEHLATLALPGLTVPTILDIPPWRDTAFLATRPLDTWTSGSMDDRTRGRALRTLATAAEVVTAELRTSQWWRGLATRLEVLADTQEARSLRAAQGAIESTIGHLRVPQGHTHGDWSPWNIAVQGTQVSAWDWERFVPQGPIGYDAIHYAVQEEVRLRAKPPRQALESVLERSALIVGENGADPELGTAICALYLLTQGEQHLTDRQLDAGSERGPISEWLVPALESATARLRRAPR